MTDDEIQKVDRKVMMQERAAKMRAAKIAKKAQQADAEPVVRRAKPSAVEDVAAARTQRDTSPRTRSDGRVEVRGHNGEVLSRTRVQVGDVFEIPAHMIPKGWSFQWNAVSIAGNKDILLDQNHQMYQNGWRPVPAERYAGTLVPKGSTGPIIRGQQMLMERPTALTEEARNEDIRNAKQLISDRNESLKLAGVKNQLGQGFEMDGKYKGTGGAIRMQIDKSLDVVDINRSAGNYQVDE